MLCLQDAERASEQRQRVQRDAAAAAVASERERLLLEATARGLGPHLPPGAVRDQAELALVMAGAAGVGAAHGVRAGGASVAGGAGPL